MYEQILPKLVKFQEDRYNPGKLDPRDRLANYIAKVYGCGLVQDDAVIVMENLIANGYIVTGKQEFHSTDQVHEALRCVAILHSTSYVMKSLEGTNWLSEFPLLHETTFGHTGGTLETFWNSMFASNVKIIHAISKEFVSGNSLPAGMAADIGARVCSADTLGKLQQIAAKGICRVARRCRRPDEPLALVCHADFHMWNMAFKKDSQLPHLAVKFFDFQAPCYGPGLTDLHIYISQVLSVGDKKRHIEDLLQTYRTSFCENALALGSTTKDLELFSMENIRREYDHRAPFGLAFGFIWIPHHFLQDPQSVKSIEKVSAMSDPGDIVRELAAAGNTNVWKAFNYAIELANDLDDTDSLDLALSWVCDE